MVYAFLASVLIFAAVVMLHVQHSRVGDRLLQRSFEGLRFPAGTGTLRVDEITVVKRVTHEVSRHSDHAPLAAFWYCVGPGPNYYVAVAEYQRNGWRSGRYQWVVRPIDEERMRGALGGDPDALHAAFGDHVEGVLRA
ncbi:MULTISPECIES: hypothetical protein [Pseudoxanthomonas]|jgi:hypothetical protein|uniref:hypothetical protein n=1 Tax=Pseudoxanthomonas TaxID=83618 RepID=UPI001619EAA7|nr:MULTISPECIES: hypothetical protein [Pseudoxanthomonas]MBB3278043.1 hypothetical protein [Pseudoxanthomonas sp. OG2]MBD9375732.1 hypothetical protein [Pseudoxanthomonas sp. PXM04]MBV7474711.1 hypothetical protein [Pseudoxanthomonas sp. PXM05]UBB25744.1 hypothetical protein LAG73_01240 [Pseudoxanthomonas japonensis]